MARHQGEDRISKEGWVAMCRIKHPAKTVFICRESPRSPGPYRDLCETEYQGGGSGVASASRSVMRYEAGARRAPGVDAGIAARGVDFSESREFPSSTYLGGR